MLIRNAESIKCATFEATPEQHKILLKHGKAPLTYSCGKWLYRLDADIEKMLEGGGALCQRKSILTLLAQKLNFPK